MSDVLWVGLSAQISADKTTLPPFPNHTPSGTFLLEVEEHLSHLTFTHINLVPFAPLDKREKLRYPTLKECEQAFPDFRTHLLTERNSLVILLGKQVATFVLKQYGIPISRIKLNTQQCYIFEDAVFIPFYHPSYIMRYKRSEKKEYIRFLTELIQEHI